MAPCAALALCSSPKVKSCCCTKAEDCCCREAGQRNTAPTPAATVANPLLDQAAEVTVGNTSGLVAPVSTGELHLPLLTTFPGRGVPAQLRV